jgi:hypothetical protein
MLVLIAGPYLSGTDGDPDKVARNRERLESFALPIYERGHLPMIGEWIALPIIHAAGGTARTMRSSGPTSTPSPAVCWSVATRCSGFPAILEALTKTSLVPFSSAFRFTGT